MHVLTFFNLAVLAFLLPLSAHAEAGSLPPAIMSVQIEYPKLHEGYIPNTFTYPYQSAFKNGDETILSAMIGTSEPVQYAAVDASAVGSGFIPLYDTGNIANEAHQFQSFPIRIASGTPNGAKELTLVIASAGGTTTKGVPVQIDNTPPLFTLTSAVTSIFDTGGTLALSGGINGTGTLGRLFSIVVRFFDAAGVPLSGGNDYYGYQEGAALRALRNGAFTSLVLPILESATSLAQATRVQIELMGKDEAGNASTTSRHYTLSTSTPPDEPPPPHATTSGSVSNVLFLPGIETSRLYADDQKLWEPESDGDLHTLSFADGGVSLAQVYTKPGDIITRATWGPFGKNIYTTLFSTLNDMVHEGEMQAWVPAAYDWRLSLSSVITGGVLDADKLSFDVPSPMPYLESSLRSLASSSPTGKVTLIAHSNGGLVAKALLHALGSAGATLVDKVILVGVPQSGTAETVALMLHGYGGALPFDSCAAFPLIGNLCAGLVSRATSRTFAEHAPAAYHLLPSQQYFRSVSDGRHHVIEFNATRSFERERTAYKSAVNTLDELHDFLAAREGGRTKPHGNNLGPANVLEDEALLAYASTTHAAIDAWLPPADMRVFQISAFGKSTLSGIAYDDYALPGGGTHSYYRPLLSLEGDGTVQSQSAVQMKTSTRVKSYWLPAGRYAHATLLASPDVLGLVTDLVRTGSTSAEVRTSRPTAFPRRITVTLHSPLTLEARDAKGNVLDADTADIPEGVYGELGETKFLSLPDTPHQITMHGTGTGTFTLDIQEMGEDDGTDRTTTLAELPVTPSTIATVSVGGGAPSALSLDEDGNGSADISLTPRPGYTVVYKPAPPPASPAPKKEPAPIATSTEPKATTTGKIEEPVDIIVEPIPTVRPQETVEFPAAQTDLQESSSSEPLSRLSAAVSAALPHSVLARLIAFLTTAFKTLLGLLFKA